MITIDVIFSFDEASVVELYLIETIDIQGVKERNIQYKQKYHNQYLKCNIYLLYIKNIDIFIILKLYQHEIII